jgi:hypothetical protein
MYIKREHRCNKAGWRVIDEYTFRCYNDKFQKLLKKKAAAAGCDEKDISLVNTVRTD